MRRPVGIYLAGVILLVTGLLGLVTASLGILGAVAAAVAFMLLPFMMYLLGGGVVTEAETRRLRGFGTLDLGGYVRSVAIVFVLVFAATVWQAVGARPPAPGAAGVGAPAPPARA